MTAAIETKTLSVRIGAKTLLDNVTLSIDAGECVALVGPNGAGKSTLLRVMTGELAASGGAILLKGCDPRAYRPAELALHRAVLSQHIDVAFPFTVREIVLMGAGEQRGRAIEAMADAALEEVGLAEMQERIIGTFSGGEQQRAHLARVLLQLRCGEAQRGPGILLLDEPTSNLDLCHQLDLLSTARRCNKNGTTILMILHDLNLAALAASRIVALSGGKLAMDGPPSAVVAEELLRDIFGVAGAANRAPPPGVPFVLPHQATKIER